MNKSDIRRIIKEEITSILNENTPKYSPGDTFMYMGTKHTVISDDGFIVTAKLPTGNIKKLNHNQIKPLNESPSVLIANKERIADEVLKSDLADKDRIANFIIRSAPSEVYLQKIVDMLGMNITDLEPAVSTIPKHWNPNDTGGINPADYGSLD
jgi:hypothetical protein